MSAKLFSTFIQRAKNPCINCTNYIKFRSNDPYDKIYNRPFQLGKCSLFGMENVVTGQIIYDEAFVCRTDKSKCGYDGKYFVAKNTPVSE